MPPLSDFQLTNRIRHLEAQLRHYDGETPLSQDDQDMVRELNALRRERYDRNTGARERWA